MASRPDYLKTYDAQSFPVEMAKKSPYYPKSLFYPPADYPVDDLIQKGPKKPRTPPLDYQYSKNPFPFRSHGDRNPVEVVRTTAESNLIYDSPSVPKPDYPTPRREQSYTHRPPPVQGNPIIRRHTAMDHSESPFRVNPGDARNKAFLHHIKNFDKFSTIKGKGACNAGCPICKAIMAANEALAWDSPSSGNTPLIGAGGRYGSPYDQRAKKYPINELQEDDEDPEAYQKERRQQAFIRDLTKRGAKVARVVSDRVSRHVRELTVTKGEYLEILDDTRHWWACSNVSGQLGYVPSTILTMVGY